MIVRLAIIAVMLLASPASAQVVVGDNVRLKSPSIYLFADYHLAISKWPNPVEGVTCLDCFTYVLFNYHNGLMTDVDRTADEGAEVYLVRPGDLANASTVGSFPHIAPLPEFPEYTVGTDFYLGLATSSRGYYPPRTHFGWVHLVADGPTSVRMVGNAMAYGSGIVVGSTEVPEPSKAMAVVAAVALLALRSRF
jgi:hypothetical protein